MPLPGVHNIEAYYGSELALAYTYKDNAGTAIDLSSATVKFVVRDSAADPRASLTLLAGSGITMTDAANGQFTVTVTADQVSDLGRRGKSVTHVYELIVVSASTTEVIVRGTFTVGSGS